MYDEVFKTKVEAGIGLVMSNNIDKIITFFGSKRAVAIQVKKYRNAGLVTEENRKYVDVLTNIGRVCKNDMVKYFDLNGEESIGNDNYDFIIRKALREYKVNKDRAARTALDGLVSGARYDSSMFGKAVEAFKDRYVNSNLFMDDLLEILRLSNEKRNEPAKRTTYLDSKSLTSKVESSTHNDIYQRVYNSGLSLRDYAHKNFVDSKLRNFFNPVANGFDERMSQEILSRKDIFTGEILEVVNKINNEEIDIIDYYKLTKLNPVVLRTIAKENGIITATLSKFANAYANPSSDEEKLDKFMVGYKVVSEEVAIDEIKSDAKLALIDNEIPLTIGCYKQMVRQLIKSK